MLTAVSGPAAAAAAATGAGTDPLTAVLLLLAGIAAGALNAAGGGGTFIALPALVAVGLPPVTANATSTVALLPGALTSTYAYRDRLERVGGTSFTALSVASLLGGTVGAVLLLALPPVSFDAAVPWLLAFATLVLAFGRPLAARLARSRPEGAPMRPRAVLVAQFLLAIYGGYFGGAVGILMLAVWAVGLGLDTARGNPMRVAQLGAVNAVAAAIFLVAADVLARPVPLLAVLVGAVIGGWGGAHVVKRLPSGVLRAVVLITAATMTVLYFLR